jgi:EmrB/QacA subfamily drug resistance transporter
VNSNHLDASSNPGGLLDRLRHLPYNWVALSVTTLGLLMFAIDATIVTLAIPQMMIHLHSDLVTMVWVIMGYMLISTVCLMTFGRIADMLGRVRMYKLGFVVFTIGSALCGIAPTGTALILFRLIQGAGGAMLAVNSMAIVTEAFPRAELGRAMGINGITFAVGAIAGPILGGLILAAGNWRWIFFINVPIGLLGAGWGYLALKEMQTHKRTEKFDPLGALSFSAGLTALLLALTLGIGAGWTSTPALILYFIFVVGLVFFLFWERRVKSPVLDFSLFKSRVYTFSVLAAMGQSLALFAVNFLIVFYLQGVRGYDPLKAALLLIPLPVMSSIMGPFSGILADRIGARIPATVGLLISAVALVLLTSLSATTSYLPLALMLALLGIGGGMFFPANTSAAMNSAPQERLGVASATLATLRQAGMVTSFALSLAVAAASLPKDIMMQLFVGTNVVLGSKVTQDFVIGMHSAFVLSIVITLIAAAFSYIRGKENRRQLTSDFLPHGPEA